MMQSSNNLKNGQLAALAALGFFALGLASLLLLLAMLAIRPDGLMGEISPSATNPVLLLAFPGVIASCLFGSLYGAASTISGVPLRSPHAALIHLVLHASGLFWMLSFAAMPDTLASSPATVGIGLLGIGIVMAIANMLITASRLNRWEPAQILILSALFWLIAGTLTIAAPAILPERALAGDPSVMIEVGTLMVMAGFLWTALLGTNLKFIHMFTAGAANPGALSWLGLVLLNLTLLNALPLKLMNIAQATPAIGGAILLASFLIIADKVRLITSAKRSAPLAQVTSLVGLLSCALLLAYLLLSTNPLLRDSLSSSRALAEAGIPAILFASAAIGFVCMGGSLIPLLVWRIRCLPVAGAGNVIPIANLSDPRSHMATTVCLLGGLGFVMAGALLADPDKLQLGFLALLTGLAWQLHAMAPAIGIFMLGINPATTTSKTI